MEDDRIEGWEKGISRPALIICSRRQDMSNTKKNLEDAFSRESQANRRYLAFAQKAAAEHKEGISKLFRALAESEAIHAKEHLSHLNAVKTTEDNLQQALAGEMQTFETRYPQMIADAKKEGETGPEIGFNHANEVEKVHYNLLEKALDDLHHFPIQDYFVCRACGYTAAKEPPESCPVCRAVRKTFIRVE
jgi:rubrerythrin